MTTLELYRLLDMPDEAVERLNACAQPDLAWLTPEMKAAYLNRATWKEGMEAIQARLGEDPDGFRMLWVLLEMARETWAGYQTRGVSREIFAETMKFVPRFLRSQLQQTGRLIFRWGWWFWRELAMVEYRVGCLEYELVTNEDGSR
jgi:hypothetical protein